MSHHLPKAQALVLLSVFLAGGVLSPLVHRISHGSQAHHQPACQHEAATGPHWEERTDTQDESCLQCVRHQVAASQKRPVVRAVLAGKPAVAARPGIPAQHTTSGQQPRAPPASPT